MALPSLPAGGLPTRPAPAACRRAAGAPRLQRPRAQAEERQRAGKPGDREFGHEPHNHPEESATLAALALNQAVDASLALPAANQLTSLWASYAHNVAKRPYRTKALTSLAGFMIGDVLAQKIEGGVGLDVVRMLRQGSYGLSVDGPIGHAWYELLDRRVEPQNPQSLKAVLLKTAADQIVWAPVMTCVYFAFLRTIEGHPELIQQTIQDKLFPTVVANYVIWPLAHFINFRFVPTQHRILYNNVVAIFWNAFLSTLSHTPTIDATGVIDTLASAADQVMAATDAIVTEVDSVVNATPEGTPPLHVMAQRVQLQIPEALHVYAEQFRTAFRLTLHEQAEQFAAALRGIDPKTVPVAPTRSYPFGFLSSFGDFCRQLASSTLSS